MHDAKYPVVALGLALGLAVSLAGCATVHGFAGGGGIGGGGSCPSGRCVSRPLVAVIGSDGVCRIPTQSDYYVSNGYDAFWSLPDATNYAFTANGIDIHDDKYGDFINGRPGAMPNLYVWTSSGRRSGVRLKYDIHFTYRPPNSERVYDCEIDPIIVSSD